MFLLLTLLGLFSAANTKAYAYLGLYIHTSEFVLSIPKERVHKIPHFQLNAIIDSILVVYFPTYTPFLIQQKKPCFPLSLM